MSVDREGDQIPQEDIPYTPPNSEIASLLASIDTMFQTAGSKEEEILPPERTFSEDAKDILLKLGFIFLRVGGESARSLIDKGTNIMIGDNQELLAPKVWKESWPRREVAVNQRFPFYPINRGTYSQLLKEVDRYNQDAIHWGVRGEVIATLGQPVTLIETLLEFERKQELPIWSALRVCSARTYAGSASNYAIQVGYGLGIGGIGTITTSGLAENSSTPKLKGLIVLEKRPTLAS